MFVKEIQDNQEVSWNQYINQHPTAYIYHLYQWKKIFRNAFGIQGIYLAAYSSKNQIVGVLPLYLMKNLRGKKVLVSNPYANYAGVCANGDDSAQALINHARKLAALNDADYIELRHLSAQIKETHSRGNFASFVLPIKQSASWIWENKIHGYVRNRVRKAKKNHLDITRVNDIGQFYKIFANSMRRLGTPVFPKKFLAQQLQLLAPNVEVLIVTHQGKSIAGALLYKFKDRIYLSLVASLQEYNYLCPNNLLYWHVIQTYAEKYDWLCLGRSTKNSGTAKFKSRWGATLIPLHYECLLHNADKTPTVDANHKPFQTLSNLWKKMPLAFTNSIGPIIVKYLPEL